MQTLMIVDDERNIRLGLKTMIERQFPSKYDIQLAQGGEEALEKYNQQRADIVITDIRMPGMDGIALIHELSTYLIPPAVMILSGYDDFQYAKEAITYRVKEYLLKPIVREDLFGALERIQIDLKQKQDLNHELHELRKVQVSDQLNYILLHPDLSSTEIIHRCHKAGLDSLHMPYRVGVIKISHANTTSIPFIKLWNEAVTQEAILFEDKDGHGVVLSSSDTIFKEFADYVIEKHLVAWISVSAESAQLTGIKQIYTSAKAAIKYSLLQTHPHTETFYAEQVHSRSLDYMVPIQEIRKLANMLGTDRVQEMKSLWHEIIDMKKLLHYDISYAEEISKYLNELVFDQAYADYGQASVEILKLYKQIGYLYNFETIYDYIHCAYELLIQLNCYIQDIKAVHVENKEMKAAIEYIHQHYDQNLNMAMVSNHVSLNYSYFSELFKAFTGSNFIFYLKGVRIQQAKLLLRQTNFKIYEIGERVGFENVKQFNRVFREIEGISAMEYRDKMKLLSSDEYN